MTTIEILHPELPLEKLRYETIEELIKELKKISTTSEIEFDGLKELAFDSLTDEQKLLVNTLETLDFEEYNPLTTHF